jgi:hypothetical protein
MTNADKMVTGCFFMLAVSACFLSCRTNAVGTDRDACADACLPDGEIQEADVPLPCGNGILDPGEACDTDELNNATCVTLGFDYGTLTCSDSCNFDTSDCHYVPICGDNMVAVDEDCDGSDLGDETCQSLGWETGMLLCADDCTYDDSHCCNYGSCGNGILNCIEDCDGEELGGATCERLGFSGGELACALTCLFDAQGCF